MELKAQIQQLEAEVLQLRVDLNYSRLSVMILSVDLILQKTDSIN